MKIVAVITLIAGLLFQLAHVLPSAATRGSCASLQGHCGCCDGGVSCPCAKDGDSEQKPAPLVPDTGSALKLPLAKAKDTRFPIKSLFRNPPSANMAESSAAVHPGGYAGTRPSVALCSLII